MDVIIRRAGVEHEPTGEYDSLSVGMDDGSPSGFSVLFMRSSDYDLDSDLDLDPYCIAVSSGRSYYGGMDRAVITRNILEIDVSDDAARVLEIDSTNWRFPLEISDVEFEALRDGLERVFFSRVHLERRDQ